ncbi:MAG: dihydrolipoamide dehydrogenase [Alphaproteobacteria bacterium]|nr:dihydrolipoamide dehydrogenase [Alphaproteobacteria bacterium]
MTEHLRADVCVIGGGSAGLTVAAGAAQLGAATILVERGAMGGDCLNYGCVPSKSLIAAARAADGVRTAGRFGIRAAAPAVDFGAVHDHVKGVIAAIAPHDSVERFTALGVRVIGASARFVAPDRIEAGPHAITARRFVVATGSGPAIPPVPGLDQVPFLTNETLFDRTEAPAHLLVLGGGPIGVEMAQAHRLLGAAVTIVEAGRLLPRDDAEAVELLKARLRRDGIVIEEDAKVVRVEKTATGLALVVAAAGGERRIAGSHLLVAAGRRPHLADLGLEAAGIVHTPKGITVDAGLRSSNRRVYAIGDCAGGPQFTHIAGYHAGIVIRNLLFRLPAKVDYRALPWTTYTTPELAQVGLVEDAARARLGRIGILRVPFAENDRARTERAEEGLVKVVTTPRGKVLGVTILGEHAGEVIQLWSLAIAKGLGVKDVAGLILPYPTLGEANKRAAGSYFMPKLFAPRTRRLVRLLLRFA